MMYVSQLECRGGYPVAGRRQLEPVDWVAGRQPDGPRSGTNRSPAITFARGSINTTDGGVLPSVH